MVYRRWMLRRCQKAAINSKYIPFLLTVNMMKTTSFNNIRQDMSSDFRTEIQINTPDQYFCLITEQRIYL